MLGFHRLNLLYIQSVRTVMTRISVRIHSIRKHKHVTQLLQIDLDYLFVQPILYSKNKFIVFFSIGFLL